MYLVHTCTSVSDSTSLSLFPSFVSVSLWPFVRSSAGLINHAHAGVWREQRGFMVVALGVGKAKLTLGENLELWVWRALLHLGDGWIYAV